MTVNHKVAGSTPAGTVAPVAQWIARSTSNRKVVGSSPTGSDNSFINLISYYIITYLVSWCNG